MSCLIPIMFIMSSLFPIRVFHCKDHSRGIYLIGTTNCYVEALIFFRINAYSEIEYLLRLIHIYASEVKVSVFIQ